MICIFDIACAKPDILSYGDLFSTQKLPTQAEKRRAITTLFIGIRMKKKNKEQKHEALDLASQL